MKRGALLTALAACLPVTPAPSSTAPPPAADRDPPPLDVGLIEPIEDAAPDAAVPPPPPDLLAHPPCVATAELRDLDDPKWGPVLRDLARHISHDGPWHAQLTTAAHESTHLMNTQINRTAAATRSDDFNGFYLLGDCAVIIVEPAVRKSDAVAYLPEELRGLRYGQYITGQETWDDVPTYIFDEWIAYIHGSAAALEVMAAGNWTDGRLDSMAGQVEFTIYALALGMATRDLDPTYFATEIAFAQLLSWNALRAFDQYRAGRSNAQWPSAEQDRLYETLRSDAVGEPMRAFVRDTYGEDFLKRLLEL